MDLRKIFTANLRRLRNAKNLLQNDLAYEAEITVIGEGTEKMAS